MPVLKTLKQLLLQNFIEARLQTLALALAVYLGLSWLALWLAGETQLIAWPNFFYWVVVTASTVGYGDLSPAGAAGRWVTILFIIPFGLGLFALTVGRVAAFISDHWKKGVRGLKTLDCNDHILVLGWNDKRTLLLLKLLLRENQQARQPGAIVLCVTDELENPMPERIEFIRASSYTDPEALARARLELARCVIIDNPDDNETMTAALYCNARNPDAHLIAYFRDESLAALLKQHCPKIECTPSVAVEMLAKSAFDPGSSALHHNLLNVEHGPSQYSAPYPENAAPATVEVLFERLKRRYQATLIGVGRDGGPININPPLDATVEPGAVVYYIATARISNLDWTSLTGAGQ